jgi:transcriptional regulator
MKTLLTPEIEERIKELRQQGLSQRRIADELGFSRQVVKTAYAKLDIVGLPNGKLNNGLDDKVLELYNQGVSIPKIAEIVNMNRANIQRFLKKKNIDISAFHITPEIEKQIFALRADGYGTRASADILGCSRSLIKDFLAEKGFKNTQPPPKVKPEITEKQCSTCGIIEDISCFGKHSRYLTDGTKTFSYNSDCDICHNLRKGISGSIHSTLKRNVEGKQAGYNQSILPHLPDYDIKKLKEHIETQFSLPGNEWMTWENWGRYNPETWDDNDPNTWTWNLDHIVPHSTFKYISMEDEAFRKCWALENLRPLNAKQNVLDGVGKVRH